MIMCDLRSGGLIGHVAFERNSYIARVYDSSDIDDCGLPRRIYSMSFGNGVQAEDRLLELLEHPAWTMLKHG